MKIRYLLYANIEVNQYTLENMFAITYGTRCQIITKKEMINIQS